MSKTAVVLFNLGGPDEPASVRPFLFNLFNDKAIIPLPQPLRYIVAMIISRLRKGKALEIYQYMGGKSPILDMTTAQAEALEKKLGEDYKAFVSMRYWHPMSDVVAKKVKAFGPDKIILLPLYPHFSVTTTGSSFSDWRKSAARAGLDIASQKICCYPDDKNFIAAHVKLVKDTYWKASEHGKPRILFSAHGLPKKVIAGGDPYQSQIETTVAAIVQVLAIDDADYAISYQSQVGPLEWIGPSTQDEIARAGKDAVPLVVVPISFVSEHSETLVELDVEYRALAEKENVPGYYRVPALGTEPFFIDALANICLNAGDAQDEIASFKGHKICESEYKKCLCAAA